MHSKNICNMQVQKITVGDLKENTYVLSCGNDALLIDPGADSGDDFQKIKDALVGKNLLAILCTHNHFDHVLGLHCFPDVPVYMHPLEIITFDFACLRYQQSYGVHVYKPTQGFLELDKTITIGPFSARVLHTPGHSPGSVCFYFEKDHILISGDTLFVGTYGRTDLPGSSPEAMRESLQELAKLPDKVHFYPGHGWDGLLEKEKQWIRDSFINKF